VCAVLSDDLDRALLHSGRLEPGHLQLDHEYATPLHGANEVLERADGCSARGRVVPGCEVQRQHLGQCLVAHAAGVRRQPIDAQVVEDDDLAIARELPVHVHAIHTRLERALDGIQTVVRRVVAEAAMGEDEGARWRGDE
jgi:hypothetical protein